MRFSKRECFLIGILVLALLRTMAFKLLTGSEYEGLIRTRGDLPELEGERGRTNPYLGQFADLEEKLRKQDGKEDDESFYHDIDDVFTDRHLRETAKCPDVEIMGVSTNGPLPMDRGTGKMGAWTASHMMMETVITMEISCPEVEQTKDFVDEVYEEPAGLFTSCIDPKGRDGKADGRTANPNRNNRMENSQAGSSVLSGMVEVRCYYEGTE